MSTRWRPIVLYQPRGLGLELPLALVALGSHFPGRRVELIDGRVELAPEARVIEAIQRAVCLAVSVKSGPQILDALGITQAARAARPDLPVIWGGWHPTFLPEQCLASGTVDACVRGQGELAFSEIVAALDAGSTCEGIAGVVWSRSGEIVHNPTRAFEDVDRLPAADYALLDLERYFRLRGAKRLDYASSRTRFFVGPFSADPDLFKQRWSGLNPDRVVGELSGLVRRHHPSEIAFSDVGFLTDPDRVEAVCRGWLDAGIRVPWRAYALPELCRQLRDETLGLMKESGCRRLLIWADLRSPDTTSERGRGEQAERLRVLAQRLQRFGLGAHFSLVASGDAEALRELRQIQRAARAIREIGPQLEASVALYRPHPGTGALERVASGFAFPRSLEEWGRVGPGAESAWLPQRVLKHVSRFNFYLRRAHQPRQPGLRGLPRWAARVRVRTGFYALDFERRLAEIPRRLRERLGTPTAPAPED